MSYNHFFLFGCWNRDNCSGNKLDYRKALAEKILLKDDYFNFGIITGDNIYQHKATEEKKKKEKNYYESTLNYGFDLLKKLKINTINKQIYGTIGNHDIDLPNILQKQIESNVLTMPYNVFSNYDNKNLRIIFIDTNLFDKKWDDSDNNELFKIKNNIGSAFYVIKNIDDLEKYLDNIKREEFNGWNIIIGHEPIISIKLKKSEYKINNLDRYEEILEKLASIPKAVYMCADVHSFQAWNIRTKEKTLPMIVVGTGGAEPDQTIENKNFDHEGINLDLLATEYPYGYCDISYNENEFFITYIPLNGCSDESNIEYTFEYNIEKNELIFFKKNIQEQEPCIAQEIEEYLCKNPDGLIKGGRKNKLYNKIYTGIYNTFKINKNLIPKGFYL